MKYTLTISENQAEIIKDALEEYFRLRLNQTFDFADSICFENFDYESHTKEDFNERIELRNGFKREFEKLLSLAHPMMSRGKCRPKTPEMIRAMDIWQVIRHKLYLDRGGDPNGWSVDARKPLKISDEPMPKMEAVEE